MDVLVGPLSAAGAAVVVVGMFLRHMATENEKNRAMIVNHLSQSVEVQARVAAALELHYESLKLIIEMLRKH